MAALVRELPVFAAFARELPVAYEPSQDALVRAVAAQWRASGGTGRPRVAIVDWADVKTRADQEILREVFAARGFACLLADPRELEVRGGRLHAPGGPVDLVYRRAVLSELVGREIEVQPLHGRLPPPAVPVRELVPLPAVGGQGVLRGAHRRGLRGAALGRRAGVRRAACCRGRGASPSGAPCKDGAEVELVPFALEHREQLVLKPAHDYGGRSVFLGSETSPSEWYAALLSALEAPWVLQERVAIPEEPFPVFDGGSLGFVSLKVNANPFYVAGESAGAVARASRSSVINVSAGGGSVPTFVVG